MQCFDIGAVMAVERVSYTLPWTEAVMSDCINGPYCCEVAMHAGELVAHMISQQVLDELHLLNLCVAQHQQRRGIGLNLLQHLLDSGRRNQAKSVFLEVRASNTSALNLYRSLGFETIGQRRDYYRDKQGREDAIVMCVDISS